MDEGERRYYRLDQMGIDIQTELNMKNGPFYLWHIADKTTHFYLIYLKFNDTTF